MGKFVKGILNCSTHETFSDLRLRMMRTQTTVIIIIIITNANNDSAAANAIMMSLWSDIVGGGIVVPFEGSVVAIAVGKFAPSVLEFVAIIEEFLMWVCMG